MSNIVKARVTIKGTRPLLIHHFTPEMLDGGRKERTGTAGNDPEEWRKSVLVTKDGQLYLEPTYVFATIRDGARYTKKGRGSIQSAVSATLQVVDNSVLVDRFFPGWPKSGEQMDVAKEDAPPRDADAPVYLDVRSVKNPSTKGRNARYRVAASPGWTATFTILWDKTIVDRTSMPTVLDDAGALVGIADGRAIGFGRFTVEAFDEIES